MGAQLRRSLRGTTNLPPLVAQDFMPGATTASVVSNKESFNPCRRRRSGPPAPRGLPRARPTTGWSAARRCWETRGASRAPCGALRPQARRHRHRRLCLRRHRLPRRPWVHSRRCLCEGWTYAPTNFGSAAEARHQVQHRPAYRRESFLKLEIGDVQPGDRISLRLFGRLSDARAAT